MKKIIFICFLNLFITHYSFSQGFEVYPSNWWVGMKWNKVQVLVYGKGVRKLAQLSPGIQMLRYPGVRLLKVHKLENPNYVAIDILIDPSAKPARLPTWSLHGQGHGIPVLEEEAHHLLRGVRPARIGVGAG